VIVGAVISAIVGGFLLLCAKTAFEHDEPEAGLIAAACGTVFLIAGVKAFPV
jgi:hypothetical protein